MDKMADQTHGTALETVIVSTTHMEELANFYQKALELGEYNLSPRHMGLQVGSVYLGFDQVDESKGEGSTSLWFTVDDIEAIFNRLVSMQARVGYPPTHKPWGAFLACVYDPDGNLIGLSQRKK
jgi:predicted enzyme related to lactoylglutathione lyase